MVRDRQLYVVLAVAASVAAIYYCAKWLTISNDPTPDELARAALHRPSLDDREAAAVALIDIGTPAVSALRRLAAESPDEHVRAAAIEGLGRCADFESMNLLLDALSDESPSVRGRAGFVVGRMLGRDRRFQADGPLDERQRIAMYYREDWTFLRDSPHFETYQERFLRP